MNEHELCCGTVADKAKLCAEIAERDLRIKMLEIAARARARVEGRTLKFAMDRGYDPDSDESELEYIMRRLNELLQESDCAHDQIKHLNDMESALDDLVSLCNNSCFLSTTDEVIHAEATLERLYKSRLHTQEKK